jgi:hypothetical protein
MSNPTAKPMVTAKNRPMALSTPSTSLNMKKVNPRAARTVSAAAV